MVKNYTLVLMQNTRYSCPILIKHEFLNRFSKNIQILKFYINLSCGNQVAPCRQMEGRTEGQMGMMKLIVTFCNFAKGHKNNILFIT
jgi:hypothetical protein